MELDEHEEQEEEIGMHQMQAGNYQTLGNSAGRGGGGGGGGGEGVSAATTARKSGGGGGSMATTSTTTSYRFRECLKNHAVAIGGHAVDGCMEFMAAGEEGTLESLKCAACNCHRNFHRKETEGEGFHQPHPTPHHPHHHPHHAHHQFSPAYPFRSHHPSGYLHVTPPSHHHHQRPLPLPSTSREDEDVSNPSSSGGGGGGGSGGAGGSKKRFRTKFSQDQKEKMLAFAERLGWRIQKQDEALVQQFCADTNVKRHVLKVWMHNNKHTLAHVTETLQG